MNLSKQRLIEQLTPEQIAFVQKRMKSRQFSEQVFLRWYQNLQSLIGIDSNTLKEIGVTPEQIADKLDYLFSEARSHRNSLIEGVFRVKTLQWGGLQVCPFRYETNKDGVASCGFASTDLLIQNERQNAGVYVAGLLPHLIRDHHFFEGGSYRLDPRKITKILELGAERGYARAN